MTTPTPTQPPAAVPEALLIRHQLADRFSFLEGVVNECNYLRIIDTAFAIYGEGAALTLHTLADLIEGMSVSVDVSTDEASAHHRYFGTVTEVMEDLHDKHGVTLLVQDAKPNFTPAAPMSAQPSDVEALRHSANEWADMATNGLQWLRNVVDGTSDAKSALRHMEQNLTYCRLVNDAPAVQAAIKSAAAAPAPTTEQAGEDDASEVDFLLRMLGTLEAWSAKDWNELFERQPSIARLVRPLLAASCGKPPAGWRCSRVPGHEGPCAAFAAPGGEAPADARDAARWRWLWNHAHNLSFSYQVDQYTKSNVMGLHCGTLADAVDRAMAAQGQKGGAA